MSGKYNKENQEQETVMDRTPTANIAGEQSLIQSLARFVGSLSLDSVPERVRQEAKLCILDTLGCILAGADSPEGQTLLKSERELSGGDPSDWQNPLSPAARARIFAYWGDVFELNDLIGGHGSIGNVTAALMAAGNKNASGAELVRAVIAGLETTCRLFAAASVNKPPIQELGNVSVTIVNSFGAAGAVASLYKLPESRIAQAIAISGALANWGPAEVIFGDGGSTKPLQFGACPADGALRAGSYAENGLTGPLRLCESRVGWLTTFTNGYDQNLIRDNDTWYLLKPQRKLHACCGFTHSSIDAVIELRKGGLDFTGAKHIELRLPDRVISGVYKPKAPTTSNEARFHIQYCVALAATGVDVIVPDHSINFETYISRPDVFNLIDNISIVQINESELTPVAVFNDLYNQSVVRVTSMDDKVVQGDCRAPRGSAGNPLSDEQVVKKFRLLTEDRFGSAAVESCIERTLALESQPDCSFIFELLDRALKNT